jgi:hypothetical protein
MTTGAAMLVLTAFLASAVEAVEALTSDYSSTKMTGGTKSRR